MIVHHPSIVVQMAVEPLGINHLIPQGFKVPVQFVNAVVPKVQLIGGRCVVGKHKVDEYFNSYFTITIDR